MNPDVVIYSDLHIGVYGNKVNELGQNIRLLDTLDAQDKVFQYVLDNPNIKELWFLGDLFDPRDKIPIPALSMASQRFQNFFDKLEKEQNRQLIKRYLVGNHDLHVKTERDTSTNVLLGKAEVIDRTTVIFGEKCTQVWVPYGIDRERFVKETQDVQRTLVPNGKPIILLVHQTIKGALTGQSNFILGDDGVTLDDLSFANLTFSGHIHKPQSMSPNVHYIGSTLQLNIGEWTEHKGAVILDSSTLEWDRLEIDSPEYAVVQEDDPDKAGEIIEQYLQQGYRPWMIRIDTKNPTLVNSISKNKELSNVRIQQVQHQSLSTNRDDTIDLELSSSDDELLLKYIKSRFGDLNRLTIETHLNSDYLMSLGAELMREANNA